MLKKWFPDRKVWAGGIVGLIAFFIGTATSGFGLDLNIEWIAAVSGIIMKVAEYLIPQSVWDVVKRVDERIISLARDAGA